MPNQCILCPVSHGETACHQCNPRYVLHSYSWHTDTGFIWLEIENVGQWCVSCDLTFADEYNIPYTTLKRWFYDHVSAELHHQNQTAKHVCIDKFALRKGHEYAVVALDGDNGQVLHLEPGRDKTAIENLLQVYGSKAHSIISDFALVKIKAMASITPTVHHVLDRFHLIYRSP